MRLSPIDALTPEQDALLTRTLGPGAVPPPPFLMWAHNLGVGVWTEGLGAYCREESSFPRRLRELSVLIPARHFDSVPAWNAHYEQAIALGISAASLDRLARREPPEFEAEDERIFYEFARQTLEEHFVTDETYAAALATFGESALLDLIGSLGSFTISSLALNVFHVAINPEMPAPFADIGEFRRASAN